jgi:ribosomal protein L7Ae-like RNA K-turn-binding protein
LNHWMSFNRVRINILKLVATACSYLLVQYVSHRQSQHLGSDVGVATALTFCRFLRFIRGETPGCQRALIYKYNV